MGATPTATPSLALAIQKARDASMPKDNIERAIAKGTGADSDAEAFESVLYEGYGPGGVAVLVEALTDNRNRTAPRCGTSSPSTAATSASRARWPGRSRRRARSSSTARATRRTTCSPAIDAGAEDVALDGDVWEIVTGPSELTAVREALEDAGVEIESAELVQRPTTQDPVEEDRVGTLMRLLEALEDNDDVQGVHANFDVDAEVLSGWPRPDGADGPARSAPRRSGSSRARCTS